MIETNSKCSRNSVTLFGEFSQIVNVIFNENFNGIIMKNQKQQSNMLISMWLGSFNEYPQSIFRTQNKTF